MRKEIKTPNAPLPIGPYNQAIVAGGFLFASGQVAIDPATGKYIGGPIEEQVKLVMSNIGAILNAAGMNFNHIVKSTLFLKNMTQFATVNSVYQGYFPLSVPARETVEVSRLPLDADIEISVIAYKE
ncbi:MAG: hypothetical protein IAF38_05725 [Bacteroidia bacterium]|nr:hypothetical protein [Bacteroidia bacterium]